MKHLGILIGLLFASSGGLCAEERYTITLLSGSTYENVKIVDNGPIDLIVMNKDGAFTLKKQELTSEDKKRFGFDEAAFDLESKKQEDARRLHEAEVKAREAKMVEMQRLAAESNRRREAEIARYNGSTKNEFSVFRIGSDGVLAFTIEYVSRPIPGMFGGGGGSLGGFVGGGVIPTASVKQRGQRAVFIVNYPTAGLVDGTDIEGYFKGIGTHSYLNSDGQNKTVLKYEYIGPGIK